MPDLTTKPLIQDGRIVLDPAPYSDVVHQQAAFHHLGGHLKTGQSWTLQNRPVDRTQNNLVLHHGRWFRQVFLDLNLLAICGGGYTDFTWAEGTATQGCDRSADQRPEWRGGISRPKREETFWRQSGKSQGFGDRVPN